MSKKKKDWKVEKERLLELSLEERRREYKGNHVPLEKIPAWTKPDKSKGKEGKEDGVEPKAAPVLLSDKVSLYKGDITILEVDAIVNAANSSLLGGGGVDGCIHKAAGPCLYDECHTLNGCETGRAKITCGYDLPAKHVIHTVGPVARGHVGKTQRDLLSQCYQNSLSLAKEHRLRTVERPAVVAGVGVEVFAAKAFPCISTGIYGFPNEPAAEIALETVKTWIKKNGNEIDRVIFCVFLDTDYKIYKEKMSRFFPQDEDVDEEAAEGLPEEVQKDTPPSKKPKSKKRGGADDDDSEEEEEEEQPAGDVTMESQTEAAAGEEDGAEVPAQGDGDEEMSQEELERKKEVAEQETSPDKLDGSEPVGAVPEDEEMDWSAAGGSQSSLGTGQPEASPQPMNSVPKAESAGTERDVPGDGGSQAPARQEKPEGDEGVGAAGEGDATQSAEATASGDVTGPAEGPPSESRNLSGDPAEAEVIQPDSNQSKERAGDLEQP